MGLYPFDFFKNINNSDLNLEQSQRSPSNKQPAYLKLQNGHLTVTHTPKSKDSLAKIHTVLKNQLDAVSAAAARGDKSITADLLNKCQKIESFYNQKLQAHQTKPKNLFQRFLSHFR